MKLIPRFFALEGLDGSGTTTQCDLVAATAERERIDFHTTAEPTTDRLGLLIREVLGGSLEVSPETLAHLFAADRCEHLNASKSGILALVEAGVRVVTDRYLFSSLAYQSVDCGLEYVHRLNDVFPLPEAVVFLEVTPDVAMTRSTKRGSVEIFETDGYQRAVVESYSRALVWAESKGVVVHRLDGTLRPAILHEKIWKIVSA